MHVELQKRQYARLTRFLNYVEFVTQKFQAAVEKSANRSLSAAAVEWATRMCCDSRTTYYHILDVLREQHGEFLADEIYVRVCKVFSDAERALREFKSHADVSDFYESVAERHAVVMDRSRLTTAVLVT